MYVCVDVDPNSGKILGSTVQGQVIEYIEQDRPVLIENPIFGNDGVEGYVVEDRRKLKGLKSVVRDDDGVIYTFDGRIPLINAAYALIHPRTGISYTNTR